jgi:hypothetical protein
VSATGRPAGRAARAAMLALAAACAPRRTTAPEPELVGASAGYTCAYRQLRDLGYTLTRTAPESGTVAGQRIVSRPLAARTEWDEITVTTPVGSTARGTVRAVARGGVEEANRRRVAAATERGRKDAATVATRCQGARREAAGERGGQRLAPSVERPGGLAIDDDDADDGRGSEQIERQQSEAVG